MYRKLFPFLILVLVMAGCDSSNPTEEVDAPAVLSADVFELQTDLFNSKSAGQNFAAAALRVWPVSIIVAANLVIPTVVTAAALEDDPEFVDGSWEWSSTAAHNGSTIEFTLLATPHTNGHDWSARVSFFDATNDVQLDDFELYSARTEDQGSVGNWSLYYLIEGQRTNVLNADFVRTSDSVKELTYSVPETAADNAGDSVRYAVDGSERTFEWTQVAEQVSHVVVWDAMTHAGQITATNYNGGEPACWDENLDDMECAPAL